VRPSNRMDKVNAAFMLSKKFAVKKKWLWCADDFYVTWQAFLLRLFFLKDTYYCWSAAYLLDTKACWCVDSIVLSFSTISQSKWVKCVNFTCQVHPPVLGHAGGSTASSAHKAGRDRLQRGRVPPRPGHVLALTSRPFPGVLQRTAVS
jgi:hypothetical protein